jgi:hypothetical protein
MEAGKLVERLRKQRQLTLTDIEPVSASIATAEQNRGFYISHSTLSYIEEGKSVPSIFGVFSHKGSIECQDTAAGEARERSSERDQDQEESNSTPANKKPRPLGPRLSVLHSLIGRSQIAFPCFPCIPFHRGRSRAECKLRQAQDPGTDSA